MPLLSVLICTYNRADLLPAALESVCNQTASLEDFEIIVIDNNSTDDTRRVTQDFMKRYSNIRYTVEPRQGLSYARNRGWQEAHSDYVAYIDDDCRVYRDWVQKAMQIILEISPDMFGGPSKAFYNGAKPLWFKDSYFNRTISTAPRPLRSGEYLRGFNMFLRKAVLEQIGGFDVLLGMDGKRVAYGEDIAIQMIMRKQLPEVVIYFHPELEVDHLVRTEKMTLNWLARSFFAKGRYVYLITRDTEDSFTSRLGLISRAVKVLVALPWDLTYRAISRDRKQYPDVRNYFYEHSSGYLRSLGRLYAQFQTSGQKKAKSQLTQFSKVNSFEKPGEPS